jgi:hypothetical protein
MRSLTNLMHDDKYNIYEISLSLQDRTSSNYTNNINNAFAVLLKNEETIAKAMRDIDIAFIQERHWLLATMMLIDAHPNLFAGEHTPLMQLMRFEKLYDYYRKNINEYKFIITTIYHKYATTNEKKYSLLCALAQWNESGQIAFDDFIPMMYALITHLINEKFLTNEKYQDLFNLALNNNCKSFYRAYYLMEFQNVFNFKLNSFSDEEIKNVTNWNDNNNEYQDNYGICNIYRIMTKKEYKNILNEEEFYILYCKENNY